jgi:hypothetical protein
MTVYYRVVDCCEHGNNICSSVKGEFSGPVEQLSA